MNKNEKETPLKNDKKNIELDITKNLKSNKESIHSDEQIKKKVLILKKEGDNFFLKKDFQSAIKKYEAGLTFLHFEKLPGQKNILIEKDLVIKLLNNKTQCYLNLGDTDKALSNTLFILDVEPTNVEGYYRAGKALNEQGKTESSWNVLQLGLKYLIEGHAFRQIYIKLFNEVKAKIKDPKAKAIKEILKG